MKHTRIFLCLNPCLRGYFVFQLVQPQSNECFRGVALSCTRIVLGCTTLCRSLSFFWGATKPFNKNNKTTIYCPTPQNGVALDCHCTDTDQWWHWHLSHKSYKAWRWHSDSTTYVSKMCLAISFFYFIDQFNGQYYYRLQWLSVPASLAATPQVTGCAPPSAFVQRLVSRVDIISGTEGRETICVTLQEFTVPCNVSGDNWWKIVA